MMRRALMQLNVYGREAVRQKLRNSQKMLFRYFLNFFFEKKKIFLLHSHENQPKFIWQNGWVKILMFSLVSRKFLAMRNIALYSVHQSLLKQLLLHRHSVQNRNKLRIFVFSYSGQSIGPKKICQLILKLWLMVKNILTNLSTPS